MDSYRIIVTDSEEGQRLDKVLAARFGDISRARLQALISEGAVQINAQTAKAGKYKVQAGEDITLTIPEAADAAPAAQDIALDIIYEDEDLLVINKPAGLVVHPGAGNHDGTLVNALLHHCGDSLSGIGGVKRPGIVHRLDKDTSGLMLVAKNDQAHHGLSAQLQDRSLNRIYHALCWGTAVPPAGKIEQPLGRDPKDRLKMAVRHTGGKDAVTHYKILQSYGENESHSISLISCKLETGRTHQIRVHMQYLGFPLVGDPLYGTPPSRQHALLKKSRLQEFLPDGGQAVLEFGRQALHAAQLSFIHPRSAEPMIYDAAYPEDMHALVDMLQATK